MNPRLAYTPAAVALGAVIALTTIIVLGSCQDTTPPADSIVLYSSVDDYVLVEAVKAFEQQTGIKVRVVGDTEATKTTGLVTRLLAEHDSKNPSADVWWSSEPFGTIRLAQAGVLAPYSSEPAESAFEDGWPSALVSDTGTWYGHALRHRVIVHSTDRAPEQPITLQELADPVWKNRIGIARPRFGTTRGHMAALLESWGTEAFEQWLAALVANNVRVYDSNSSVVRAVWMGEIDAGLTDTDDVYVGMTRGWPVRMAPPTDGPLTVPCTVGLVTGGSNPEGGRAFIDWVLSGAGERVLASSESMNIPVHPSARPSDTSVESSLPSDGAGSYERISERIPEAMEICERILTGG